MAKQHLGTGVSHDVPGLSLSNRLIAVNRTVGASWLVFSIGTFLQPQLSIILKFPARYAQDIPGTVMVSGAIHADHLAHGYPFTGKAFLFRVHSDPVWRELDQISDCHLGLR